jgi:hypothetical protein
MPSLTIKIPNESELAKKILRECQFRIRQSERRIGDRYDNWSKAEDKTQAYMPERQVDALRKDSRETGGLPQYTTIQIPYSYAVLMAAHTYVTSVFLGRAPVLQVSGRHGEPAQSVQAVEALLDYQMLVGKGLVPIYIWLYDFLKYGIGIVGNFWEDRYESIASVEEVPSQYDPLTGQPISFTKQLTRMAGLTYSGNRLYNIQPWDFLWDTRYPAWQFQKGEYLAVRFSLNWNEVKRREFNGYYTNLDSLGAGDTSGWAGGTNQSSSSIERPDVFDQSNSAWDTSWAADRKHPSMVRGYETYVELIPKEWGLGNSDYPEKWVFTITSDFKTLLGAQPLGAWHCQYPVQVLNLEPEGYGITTRGIPEILDGVQNTIDWLINSHFYNIRAALNNKFVVDPSKVVMKDVLNPLPGGVIRLKPAGYGSDPQLAIRQMQINDVTQVHLRDLPTMFGIGERTLGINDQIMGMLNAGGRKTATEVRTSTSFGTNRLKTICEFASVSGFDPLSQMMIQNTQQYYDLNQKFKIAGDLLSTAGMNVLQVTPEMVIGAYDFVNVDGTLPIDRYAQSNMWIQMMGQARMMPELAMQFDWAKMFTWIAQLAGLKNIQQFKIQISPDQVLAAQAQAGNVVPMNGPGGRKQGQLPKPTSPAATSPEVGQIPGMGATG